MHPGKIVALHSVVTFRTPPPIAICDLHDSRTLALTSDAIAGFHLTAVVLLTGPRIRRRYSRHECSVSLAWPGYNNMFWQRPSHFSTAPWHRRRHMQTCRSFTRFLSSGPRGSSAKVLFLAYLYVYSVLVTLRSCSS